MSSGQTSTVTFVVDGSVRSAANLFAAATCQEHKCKSSGMRRKGPEAARDTQKLPFGENVARPTDRQWYYTRGEN